MKIHFEYHEGELFVPQEENLKGIREGLSPTLCEYTRKKVTVDKDKVTCFYCLKQIEKQLL